MSACVSAFRERWEVMCNVPFTVVSGSWLQEEQSALLAGQTPG